MIISLILLAGCNKNQEVRIYSSDINSSISLTEKEDFFSIDVINDLEKYLRQGVSINEGLRNSGIVDFDEAGNIETINHVSLATPFTWRLEINGKKMEASNFNTVLKTNDEIAISIQSTEQKKDDKSLKFIILKLNGDSINRELNHSYVIPFVPEQSVRDIVKYNDLVELTANNKFIDTVRGYSPKAIEKWVIKVNGKELIENGLDMKLTPQDEVEILLERI
ncbi:hypothetical protein [Paenibacillus pini]|uniref:Uncharacterized protein n=1 Tax=Paenibacillus pini JCM 16418 TaxID=1236976 RepID=W7Y8J1_9BACL|nr:hypothetical protein [Paenibacillus pini]GAF07235.1 hypothetical protein JCM16418_1229 [Paenibacillus pini JCM 16418]